MLDADHFKDVNDNFGHDVGDRVLRAVADACRRVLRKTDILGRFGGEEFAVVFEQTGLADARMVSERLLAAVAGSALTVSGARGGNHRQRGDRRAPARREPRSRVEARR